MKRKSLVLFVILFLSVFTLSQFPTVKANPDTIFSTVRLTSVHTCPLDSHTFVIAYHDEVNDDFSFQIYDTNGTQILAETDVDTTSGGSMFYTSIGVSAFNSTTFVIGWYDGTDADATFAVYNTAGTLLSGPTDVDTDVALSFSVQVSCFNSTYFVIAWYDQTDQDVTFAVYTSSSVLKTGPIDADTSAGTYISSYSVSVSCFNNTTFVIGWFDGTDFDATFSVYNSNGTLLTGPKDADTDVQSSFSVSVCTFNSTHFVIGWYDYADQDATFAIYNSAGTLKTGPIDADTAVGTTCKSVQVSALNNTAFVISWYDAVVDFDLSYATYLSDGTLIASGDIESWATASNTPFQYQSPCSQETGTGIKIYNDNWVIAYSNTTTQAIWKTFMPNGTAWDGTIPVPSKEWHSIETWGYVDWMYGKTLNLIAPTVNASTIVNPYQLNLTVHYGSGVDSGNHVYLDGKCQADFDDLRFFAGNGTETPYWIQNKVDGDYAFLWFKTIESLTQNRKVYLFYGNPSASSVSDGDATFYQWDDFNDGILTNLTRWDIQGTGFANETGGFVDIKTTASWGAKRLIDYPNVYDKEDGYETQVTWQSKEWGGESCGPSLYGFYQLSPLQGFIEIQHFTYSPPYKFPIQLRTLIGASFAMRWESTQSFAFNTWHIMKVRVKMNYVKLCIYDIDGILQEESSWIAVSNATDGKMFTGALGINDRTWTTLYFTRGYHDTEPTFGAWGSEERYGALILVRLWQAIEQWSGNIISRLWRFIETWWGNLEPAQFWRFVEQWWGNLLTRRWNPVEIWAGNVFIRLWQIVEQWLGTLWIKGWRLGEIWNGLLWGWILPFPVLMVFVGFMLILIICEEGVRRRKQQPSSENDI